MIPTIMDGTSSKGYRRIPDGMITFFCSIYPILHNFFSLLRGGNISYPIFTLLALVWHKKKDEITNQVKGELHQVKE